jgi:hypothetical protein
LGNGVTFSWLAEVAVIWYLTFLKSSVAAMAAALAILSI